ncbi:hypothetical protein BAUCODRAFT_546740 [Baudoinia panamericana UAMH 10762]|uniref:Uncharacterized protein n=1 Tax=Baudoinia panamericana (strain UAMH 10762) TaxID=717646 RepID=M2LJH3_BAUPA|nr:uncharacterized protein BAUCODRAFT_546740 [Baudoinia panamericana UAMH 10762]EMC94387.1 hypothetical protein BAUCODRAFT_546740 [Baudoinia panamericana UAMH 10762]
MANTDYDEKLPYVHFETVPSDQRMYDDFNREFEVTEWDLSTRVLRGLSLGFDPAAARRSYEQGETDKRSNRKVQEELRSVAVSLYNHQRVTAIFRARTTEGNNVLAYLLCASYEGTPPGTPEKNGRPKLRQCVPLPLGHWDRLYYAICAEIRSMYEALQSSFGNGFEDGTVVLHNAGLDAASCERRPISAVGLASLLEDKWLQIHSDDLVAALDLAVRFRNAQDATGSCAGFDACPSFYYKDTLSGLRSFDHEHGEKCYAVHVAEGLINTNTMTPEGIMQLVWTKQAHEAHRKSGKVAEKETLLARCRAYVRECSPETTKVNEQAAGKRLNTAFCGCGPACYCRAICDLQSNERSCAHLHNQVRNIVGEQETTKNGVHDLVSGMMQPPDTPVNDEPKDVYWDLQSLPNNMLGAVSNGLAQMEVAAMAQPDPLTVQACHIGRQAGQENDSGEHTSYHRAPSNTTNSDLASIPPLRTPSRGRTKDAYPLGFYGDSSGQRYPTLRSNTAQDLPPPVYGASFYSTHVPARKPVATARAVYTAQAEDTKRASPIRHITYPAIPKSESQGLFTRSFPVPARGNPRDIEHVDNVNAYNDLAQEAHNAIRPFSDEPTMYAKSTPTRHMAHTATTSPDGLYITKTRENSFDIIKHKAHPPLPEPDFMAPRPALKQRYVSAGGNAKLSERAEIAGPAFGITQIPNGSGTAIPKEELFQKLSDPEFIRGNFGEEAVGKMSFGVDRERTSCESSPSKRSSGGSQKKQRASAEGSMKGGDKRERTDSGGSVENGRFEKLKRVFSRKNSGCE